MSGRVRGGPRMAAMWAGILLGCLIFWALVAAGVWWAVS